MLCSLKYNHLLQSLAYSCRKLSAGTLENWHIIPKVTNRPNLAIAAIQDRSKQLSRPNNADTTTARIKSLR